MELKLKKLIAREFLLILGGSVIIVIMWMLINVGNSFYSKKYAELTYELDSVDLETRIFESKYRFYYDDNGSALVDPSKASFLPPDDAIRFDSVLSELAQQAHVYQDHPVLSRYENKVKPWELSEGEKMRATNEAVDSLNALKNSLSQKRQKLQAYEAELDSMVSMLAITLLIVLYPLRFIVFSVVWAIRTLRS